MSVLSEPSRQQNKLHTLDISHYVRPVVVRRVAAHQTIAKLVWLTLRLSVSQSIKCDGIVLVIVTAPAACILMD